MKFYEAVCEQAKEAVSSFPVEARKDIEQSDIAYGLYKELEDMEIGHEEGILVSCAAILGQSENPQSIIMALSLYFHRKRLYGRGFKVSANGPELKVSQ